MASKIRDIDIVDEPHYQGAELYNEKMPAQEDELEDTVSILGELREQPSSDKRPPLDH